MRDRFTDRVALVTGGGSGIGRAVARALANEGAVVVVSGRRDEPLAETVRLIEDEGGRADAIRADVTREDDVRALVETTVRRHGRLDVAVNNAGILDGAGPLHLLDEDAWTRVVDANLNGVWRCLKHEVAAMREQGGGAIVNVASNIGAHMTLPFLAAYATAKAGVSTLTRVAARECIDAGVRINAVSPGPVDTPMSLLPGEQPERRAERLRTALPIGRVGSRDEVAAAVLWLAAPEASFVVGHDLVVDGAASA